MTDHDPTNPFAPRPNPARDNSGLDLGRVRRAAPSGKAALTGIALTDELIAELEAPTGYGGQNSEDGYELYDDLRLEAAARIRALIAERDEALAYGAEARIRENKAEDARVSASFRAEKTRAEAVRLRGLLGQVRDWLADPKLDTWPYMDGPGFYDDKATWVGVLSAALATEDTP